MLLRFFPLLVVLLLACSEKSQPEDKSPPPPAKKDASTSDAQWGTSGRHRGGDKPDWVPAEFKTGRAKWKDAGVYVDGKAIAMLSHGELPRGLKPFWTEKIDEGDPETQRFRFVEYLDLLGVDTAKMKEMHIYGGGLHVLVLDGDDVRKHKDKFHFRFGRGTSGKAILGIAPGMKINTGFDKVQGVTVYIDKKPPKVSKDERLVDADGNIIWEVPYYGEPMRGGVRIYKNDTLALHLKRNKLEESKEVAEWATIKGEDGKETKELRYKLIPFLEKYGVDTKDVVVAEVVRDDQRQERLSKADLDGAYFTAPAQASGQIHLGDSKLVVRALALYTKPLPPKKAAAPPKK